MKTKKCVQSKDGTKIKRVYTKIADMLVKDHDYKFIPRHIWKKEVRDKIPK